MMIRLRGTPTGPSENWQNEIMASLVLVGIL